MKHKIYSNKTFQVKAKDVALDALFNLFPINFSWVNRDGFILGCNQELMRCLNIQSFDSMVGEHITDFSSKAVWENTQKVIETGDPFIGEEIHIKADGSTLYFWSMKNPIKDCEGNVIGAVNIALDITERKSMELNLRQLKEAAELADKVKTDFLINMRHDLKTPLSGIVTISEFLKNSETQTTRRSYLQDIKQCAESLLTHLGEILDQIKIESGEFSIIEKEFNIHSLLKNIYSIMLPSSKTKHIDFTLTLDYIPPNFIGDVARTERILINLISNAINFTEKGYVKFVAHWFPSSNGKGTLQFIIEDSGVGIPEDKKSIIFEKFCRLNPSYEGIYAGSGLGLHIVRQFIEEIGGTYDLQTTLGKGTSFTVNLPYKVPVIKVSYSDIPIPNEPLNTPIELNYTLNKYKVLLVEDNKIIARISKDLLESLNCIVDIAPNGKEAINLIDKFYYDLILMDIGLPDMDGYKVTQHIRTCNITTPIIAITAHSEDKERKKCLEVGMNEMITKPLTQAIAKSIISKL
jgi:two-component system, OmpR family, aerobic respiration control sensor histidine kinase ArcB